MIPQGVLLFYRAGRISDDGTLFCPLSHFPQSLHWYLWYTPYNVLATPLRCSERLPQLWHEVGSSEIG